MAAITLSGLPAAIGAMSEVQAKQFAADWAAAALYVQKLVEARSYELRSMTVQQTQALVVAAEVAAGISVDPTGAIPATITV